MTERENTMMRTESQLLVLDDGREQRVVRQFVDCSKLRGEEIGPFLACEPGIVYMEYRERAAWPWKPLLDGETSTCTMLRGEMLTGDNRLAGLVGAEYSYVPDGMIFQAAAIRAVEHAMVADMLDRLAEKLASVAAL